MADETVDAPQTDTEPVAPESTTPAAAESQPQSFGEALRATTQPSSQSFTQADLDARLASERETWQKAQDEKYAWAKDLNPDEVQSWRQIITEANQSPVEVATRMLAAALASGNPQHRQAALSFAGRLLAQRQEAPAQTTGKPVDLTPIQATKGDGSTVELFDSSQVKALISQAIAEVKGELTPIQETFRTQAERQAALERQQADAQTAQDVFSRFVVKPGFKDHQKEIYEAWAKLQGNDDPHTAERNLTDAYVGVVFGKLQASASSATAADNARRAAASTGRVVTSQPTQTSPSAPVGFAARLEQEMSKQRREAS